MNTIRITSFRLFFILIAALFVSCVSVKVETSSPEEELYNLTNTPAQITPTFFPSLTPPPSHQQTQTPTITSTIVAPTPETNGIMRRAAICRLDPDVSSQVEANLFTGDQVLIGGRNSDSSWLLIRRITPRSTCWIATESIKTDISITELQIIDIATPTLASTTTPTITSSPTSRPFMFTIDSRSRRQGTGISVNVGDQIEIVYLSGSWTLDKNNDVYRYVGADGYSEFGYRMHYPVQDAYPGVVIAKIGPGAFFGIGIRKKFIAEHSGQLYLQTNDDKLADNQGSITVQIFIDE